MPPDHTSDPASPPVSPLVRLWTIGGEVLGMFPKWLLVAALAVFIAFHAFSYYQQARQLAAETARIEVESRAHTGIPPAPPITPTHSAPIAGTGAASTPAAPPLPLHAGQRPTL